VIYFHNYWNKN